ncbi:hypothetical protein DFJ66_7733 [Saccharothrix variisporea]|uniref:Uncharacterized protein n=1 Tax=Saccharothrix variisporea TaxID=543527 RepID=A0A495XMF7_9PSEU|nr:hypothetical protein DFJ66_7733 [Saccharothrix variisporea]
MWLACRTAEYSDQLTTILARELRTCVVGDLAPLTRRDAEALVAGAGVEVEGFFDAVVGGGVGPLAAIPLTLQLLLNLYVGDPGRLDDGPQQLFERGVEILVAEPDPGRSPSTRPTVSTVQQRVAVAARVAAHLLLSGRRWVHDEVAADLADQAVPLGQVVGAAETAGAGPFEVTKSIVEETLATALFTKSGPGRVAFAHSSFAAFLAARYLSARLSDPGPIAQRQLEGFFLVSAPDEDTAAIPEHLRETAAWLLAQAPTRVRWLATADPESLTAHTAVVTDDETRRLLVAGLLDRADRIELVERSWQRARWDLRHSGLHEQLVSALEDTTLRSVTDWPTHARARLALRLAADSRLPALAAPLLRLAENEGWPIYLRQRASRTAMALDPGETTIAGLRGLLATLAPSPADGNAADPFEKVDSDSRAELVGTLLRLLWPARLTFAEASVHIRPGATGLLGSYRAQVSTFPDGVADDDLGDLVSFTEAALRDCGVVLEEADVDSAYEDIDNEDTATAAPMPVPARLLGAERVSRLRRFVAAVTERVLRSTSDGPVLDRAARMLLWFLGDGNRIALPTSIDLVRSDGTEPDEVRDRRRNFTEALLAAAHQTKEQDRDYSIYRVFAGWTDSPMSSGRDRDDCLRRGGRNRLLDERDADWAASRAQHHRATDPGMAATFASLADSLATPREAAPTEFFPVWESAEDFAVEQRDRLDHAVGGDTTAFWRLVKYLDVDPTTGIRQSSYSWSPANYAGAALWSPEEFRERFPAAALRYLTDEHDHRTEWLGVVGDWRAIAAMVAFAAVKDAEDARDNSAPSPLEKLPIDCWKNWVGAILDQAGRFGSGNDFDRDLLAQAGRYALPELSEALTHLVRVRFARGETHFRLSDLPATLTPTLITLAAEAIEALRASECSDVSSAGAEEFTAVPSRPIAAVWFPQTQRAVLAAGWASLLTVPLATGDHRITDLALDTLASWPEFTDPDLGLEVAARSAIALLESDAVTHWAPILDHAPGSTDLGRKIALSCASDDRTDVITRALRESQLASLVRWLATVCPPDTEVYEPGFAIRSAEIEVHQWRRAAVAELARRGTPDAVLALRDLTNDHPDLLDIQAALHDARRTVQARTVVRIPPADVTALLNDPDRRIVRSANQLATVVLETLDHIAEDLDSHGNLLWDCERGPRPQDSPKGSRRPLQWRPKPEGTLAAYIAHELHLRLVSRHIVVNREVVVLPTDQGDSGERPDIKIDIVSKDRTAESPVISIPIEVKGSWHEHLVTAQETQLASGYITDMGTTDGVYLVGWYPLEYWNVSPASDNRRSAAASHESVDNLHAQLLTQAVSILDRTQCRTHPYLLVVPRAVSSEDRVYQARKRKRAM